MRLDYTPQRFATDYHALQGSSQYPMFCAVVLGAKPSYDDWVDTRAYDAFVDLCQSHELVVEPDVVFTAPPSDTSEIIGAEQITTTCKQALPISRPMPAGTVHVFVARERSIAVEAKKSGWYPVVIDNRSVNKPFIDHLRFGRLLGFPDCCVDWFRQYNDWGRFSHPRETLRNTPAATGRATGSYLCNNYLMDYTCSFIHHIPCSYRCVQTIAVAGRVRDALRTVEPGFVSHAERILRLPLLVFGERNFIIFDGSIRDGVLSYHDSHYIRNPARPESAVAFHALIAKGDTITLAGESLRVSRGQNEIAKIPSEPAWFLIDWD